MQTAFEGLFPRDHPKNSRFAINFFSLIGLGGLTLVFYYSVYKNYFRIDLREHLNKKEKKVKKEIEEDSAPKKKRKH